MPGDLSILRPSDWLVLLNFQQRNKAYFGPEGIFWIDSSVTRHHERGENILYELPRQIYVICTNWMVNFEKFSVAYLDMLDQGEIFSMKLLFKIQAGRFKYFQLLRLGESPVAYVDFMGAGKIFCMYC